MYLYLVGLFSINCKQVELVGFLMSNLVKKVDKLYRNMMKSKCTTKFIILNKNDTIPTPEKNVLQVLLIL